MRTGSTTAQQILVEQWATEVKAAQIEALVTAIAETDSLSAVADLEAPVLGEAMLIDAMTSLAESADTAAVGEAAAQVPHQQHGSGRMALG
jgi:hypothetical protein